MTKLDLLWIAVVILLILCIGLHCYDEGKNRE